MHCIKSCSCYAELACLLVYHTKLLVRSYRYCAVQHPHNARIDTMHGYCAVAAASNLSFLLAAIGFGGAIWIFCFNLIRSITTRKVK